MMRKFFKYLSYILRHKYFVFLECYKRGLILRGITHDLSKFLPREFIPYMNHFYGNTWSKQSKTGYNKSDDKKDDPAFDFAWLLHQKCNPHHHQWWVLPEDNGGQKILEMSLECRKEMLADWIGAGKAQGFSDTKAWYKKNKNKMCLGPETREWIEKELGISSEKKGNKSILHGRSVIIKSRKRG